MWECNFAYIFMIQLNNCFITAFVFSMVRRTCTRLKLWVKLGNEEQKYLPE